MFLLSTSFPSKNFLVDIGRLPGWSSHVCAQVLPPAGLQKPSESSGLTVFATTSAIYKLLFLTETGSPLGELGQPVGTGASASEPRPQARGRSGRRRGVPGAALTCKGLALRDGGSQQFVGPGAGALKPAEEGAGFLRPRPRRSNRSGFSFSRPARPLTCSNPLCGGGGRGSLRPCRACALGFPDAAEPDPGATRAPAGSGSPCADRGGAGRGAGGSAAPLSSSVRGALRRGREGGPQSRERGRGAGTRLPAAGWMGS